MVRTDLRTSISQEIRGSITAAVSPLKEAIVATRSEIGDLRNRVSVLESIPTGSSSSGMNTSTVLSPEVKSMLDSLDPAHRQIVFTGFDLSMTQPDRTKLIQNFISGFSTVPSSSNFGAIFTGPSNKRAIADKSYVEFSSIDDARAALKIMESGVFHVSGKKTRVKAALSKINRSRNWALRAAKTILAEFAKTSNDFKNVEVEIVWKGERGVKVGTERLFIQNRDELKGSFVGCASHLKLP